MFFFMIEGIKKKIPALHWEIQCTVVWTIRLFLTNTAISRISSPMFYVGSVVTLFDQCVHKLVPHGQQKLQQMNKSDEQIAKKLPANHHNVFLWLWVRCRFYCLELYVYLEIY